MLLKRTSLCVAIGLLVFLVAAPSYGQGPQGFQIFAPADVSTYGGGQPPNEGYFFQFDGLWWSISPPEVGEVGFPGTREVYYGPDDDDMRIQSNTFDTAFIDSEFSAGNRFEFGRVEDRDGWFVSIYQMRDQTQTTTGFAVDMVFNDPAFGNNQHLLEGPVGNDPSTGLPVTKLLPVTFDNILAENAIDTWGVEANYLHRFRTRHHGGTFELFLGARYLEFNDNFRFHTGVGDTETTGDDDDDDDDDDDTTTTATTTTVPYFLGGSFWDTSAENHIVGPQIGLRWFKKRGRWTLSTEGRFMAGLNCQNFHQQVNMGPNLDPGSGTLFYPTVMGQTTATHVSYAREWSPLIELRLDARYQITRAFSFRAGWTGVWINGVARANNVIDYTVPALGIDLANNREDLFINGLTIGFDVNR